MRSVFPGRDFLVPGTVLIVMILLTQSWFGGMAEHEFFYIHDQSAYVDQSEGIGELYAWSPKYLGSDHGMNINSLPKAFFAHHLLEAGLNPQEIQRIIFALLFVLPFLTMYLFLRNLIESRTWEGVLGSTFGALLYSFNLFLITTWHAGHIFLYSAYFILPLVLTELLKLQKGQKVLVDAAISSGFLVLIAGVTNPPSFVATLLVPLVIFSTMLLYYHKEKLREILFLNVAVLLLFLLLHAWWIIPFVKTYTSSAGDFTSAGSHSLDYMNTNDADLLSRMMLVIKWTFFAYWPTERLFHSFSEFYRQSWVVILWLTLTATAFAAFFIDSERHRELKRWAVGSLLLYLTALLLSQGTREPLSIVFRFLYDNVPFFNMFRTPGNKFSSGIVVSLSIMLGISAYLLLVKLEKFWAKIIVSVSIPSIILMYSWPFLTGAAVRELDQGRMPDNVTAIADEYYELAYVLNEQEGDGKVLSVPGKQYTNFYPEGDLENAYEGEDILNKIVNREMIYDIGESRGFQKSAEVLNLVMREERYELLPFLGISHIISRRDTKDVFKPLDIEAVSRSFTPIKAAELGVMYKVKDEYQIDKFYSPTQIHYSDELFFPEVDGTRFVVINEHPEFLAKSFTQPASIEYSQVNPTKYNVSVLGLGEGQSFILVFSESFHRDWVLHGTDREQNPLTDIFQLPRQNTDHLRVNHFANGWVITNESGADEFLFTVEFWPQRLVYLGFLVSGLTIMGLAGLFAYRKVSARERPSLEQAGGPYTRSVN